MYVCMYVRDWEMEIIYEMERGWSNQPLLQLSGKPGQRCVPKF